MAAAGGVPVRSGEDTGGQHQAAGGLPARPQPGAAGARAHLEYRGAHRAPGTWRRVRDALARGGWR